MTKKDVIRRNSGVEGKEYHMILSNLNTTFITGFFLKTQKNKKEKKKKKPIEKMYLCSP